MARIEENTVKAINQLKNRFVFVHEKENADKKILFVGNSITLHGVKTDIGWHNAWGMAASSEENDYVHKTVEMLENGGVNTSFCIAQVAEWEAKYKIGSEILKNYEEARDFGADIIIMRLIENCPGKDFEEDVFESEYKALIDYFNPENKAKIILTTSFWRHTGDEVIRKVANDRKYPCIELGDLGKDDAMMAKGLFEHSGVAMHPGDLGMKTIAERIYKVFCDSTEIIGNINGEKDDK